MLLVLLSTTAHAQLSQLHPIEFNNGQWAPNFNRGLESSGAVLDIRRFARIPYNPNASGGLSAPRLSSMRHAPGIDGFFVTDEGLFGDDSPESGSIYQVSSDGSNVRKVVDFESLRDLTHEDGADAFGQNRFWNFQGGLRSIAFHPDFDKPAAAGYRKLYTSQIEIPPDDLSGLNFLGTVPNPNVSGHSVVSEWSAAINPQGELSLVPDSFREVMRIAPRAGNHPIRQIAFDPQLAPSHPDYGLLHVLHGDGAEGNNIAPSVDLAGNTAFGKLLRVNPLEDVGNSAPYSIPTNNPFYTNGNVNDASGNGFLQEVFTHKHRNPHTLAFAQDGNGESVIFVSEIGRNVVEEINLVRPGGGGNYGWNSGSANREGTVGARPGDSFIYPVAQYGRSGSSSRKAAVAGGFAIQNGSELDGLYLLADFPVEDPIVKKPIMAISIDEALNATVTGNPNELTPLTPKTTFMLFDHDGDPRTASQQVGSYLDILLQDDTGFNRTDIRFAQGPVGEVYLLNKRNGWIYEVTNSREQVGDLHLTVNADTGAASLVNGGSSSLTFDSYSIFSGNGVLSQSGWQPLQGSQGGAGWQLDDPSAQVLREANSQGGTLITADGQLSLGTIFSPSVPEFGTAVGAPDILRFKYSTQDGQLFNGRIELVGDNLINNLLLTVDPETGEATLSNSSTHVVQLRGYSILSDSGSLKPGDGDWNSLSDQSFSGLDEANVSATNLSELIPFDDDSLRITPGELFSLGDLFTTTAEGGSEDLELSFVIENTVFADGDYNSDGIVDAADFTVWRDAFGSSTALPNEAATPGLATVEDYNVWVANFGATSTGGGEFSIIDGVVRFQSSVVTVPEPSGLLLALMVCVPGFGLIRRSRSTGRGPSFHRQHGQILPALMVGMLFIAMGGAVSEAGIINGDFESPGGNNGNPFPQADDWGGDARTALHSAFGPGTFSTLGASFAFNQGINPPAFQETQDIYTVGFTYRFDGFGTHNGSSADVVFELGYHQNGMFNLLASETYDQNPIQGSWVRHDGVEYTPAPNRPEVGENVVVRFRSTGSSGVWLDDVALTRTEAPNFGDVDGNDLVDLSDYLIIRDNFQTAVTDRSQGDLTGRSGSSDGFVDFYDFVEWSTFFAEAPGISFDDAQALAEAIPEPNSCILAVMGLFSLLAMKRRYA